MSTPSTDNAFIGKGKLLFAKHNPDGTMQAYRHFGNCSKFELTPKVEKGTVTNYMDAAGGDWLEYEKSKALEAKVTGYEFDSRILSLIFLGDESVFTQAARASAKKAAALSAANAAAGVFFELGERDVAVTIVEQGATALVQGTDWKLYDAANGIIQILPDSPTFEAGTAVDVTYSAPAITADDGVQKVALLAAGVVTGTMLFISNPQRGRAFDTKVFKLSMSPDGALGLITENEEPQTWNMLGTALSDSAGQYGGSTASPFATLIQRSAA